MTYDVVLMDVITNQRRLRVLKKHKARFHPPESTEEEDQEELFKSAAENLEKEKARQETHSYSSRQAGGSVPAVPIRPNEMRFGRPANLDFIPSNHYLFRNKLVL